MKKIVLLCAGGLSSSILVNNMRKEAEAEGFACTIDAYAVDAVQTVGKDADCILLGPQIAYKLDDIKKYVTCPVQDLDLPTYGMMDGKKAFNMARELMGA